MSPAESSGFGQRAYWDALYEKGGTHAPLEEWLRPLADYLPHLAGALAQGDHTLIVGCGNSAAAFDLVELEKARLLEPLARLWLELARLEGGGVDLNFQLLRRAIAGGP